MVRRVLFFLFLGMVFQAFGQSMYYSVESQVGMNSDQEWMLMFNLASTEEGDVWNIGQLSGVIVPENDFMGQYIALRYDNDGVGEEGFIFDLTTGSSSWIRDFEYRNGFHAIQALSSNDPTIPIDSVGNFIFGLDFENEVYWARRTNNNWYQFPRLSIGENRVYFYQEPFKRSTLFPVDNMGIGAADLETGDLIWNRLYSSSMPLQGVITTSMCKFPSEGTSAAGRIVDLSGDNYSFVLNVNEEGDIISSATISQGDDYRVLNHLFDNEGNIIFYGRTNIMSSSGDGFIFKVSPELDFVWGRRFDSDFFSFDELEVAVFQDNSLLFSYSTKGNFPVITGRISSTGNLIDYAGIHVISPNIHIGIDNSVYYSSPIKSNVDGSTAPGPIMIRTDSTGIIEGCDNFLACLQLQEFQLEVNSLEWTFEEVPGFSMYEVEVEEFDFTTSPYCVTPPPPTPTFTFPDTLCAGACASPDSLNNRLAHQAQWYVQGPGVDTLIADTTFALCFIEPGEYLIEQEVWLLGCSEIEQHTLTVLPPLQTSFNRTDTICGALPVSLSVQADRVLRDWNWSTGATIPSLPITQSGTYALTVSDGYCADTLSAELTLVAELAEEAVVQLPPEQTICATELPYLLQPFSPYTTNFTLLNNGQEGTVFALTEPGTYTVQAEYLGCPFTSTFRLQTSTCANTLYWPNVFSPNADGINDRWAPQSPEHDLTLLQIFDRWGGLVYESRAADAYWDGRGRDGEPAIAGVYVGLVRYRHRVSGEEGMEQGEVLLIR
jgi:gliding motility-associated-like protein